jgi:hypothetical protein
VTFADRGQEHVAAVLQRRFVDRYQQRIPVPINIGCFREIQPSIWDFIVIGDVPAIRALKAQYSRPVFFVDDNVEKNRSAGLSRLAFQLNREPAIWRPSTM